MKSTYNVDAYTDDAVSVRSCGYFTPIEAVTAALAALAALGADHGGTDTITIRVHREL